MFNFLILMIKIWIGRIPTRKKTLLPDQQEPPGYCIPIDFLTLSFSGVSVEGRDSKTFSYFVSSFLLDPLAPSNKS